MGLQNHFKHLKKVFTQPPMAAYRRDANLQDILVHGKHKHKRKMKFLFFLLSSGVNAV